MSFCRFAVVKLCFSHGLILTHTVLSTSLLLYFLQQYSLTNDEYANMFMFCSISSDKLVAFSKVSRIIPASRSEMKNEVTAAGMQSWTPDLWDGLQGKAVASPATVRWKWRRARAQRPSCNYRPPSTVCNLKLAGSGTGTVSPAVWPSIPEATSCCCCL